MNEATFPFTALVAQAPLQQALLLAAVDPALGGVLVSGPRGTAKSTTARALAELLPEGRFVTLPLGASEEQLIGTLDLEAVLRDGGVRFSPGLLAKAHQGVLYVDEVNLLPNSLVDQLLDVAGSGVNVIERDGISHRHDARFVLVGTMNPEEGELRPQLLDRFGLAVMLENCFDASVRQEIPNRFGRALRIGRMRWRSSFDTLAQCCRASHSTMRFTLASVRCASPDTLMGCEQTL
jgi:magnesium chelatase subunit I